MKKFLKWAIIVIVVLFVGLMALGMLVDANKTPEQLREDMDWHRQGQADANARANDIDRQIADLRAQVEDWQARFEGRQFLLPPYKAAPLMRRRDDYLAATR